MSKYVENDAPKHSSIRTRAKVLLVGVVALVLGSALIGGVAVAQELLGSSTPTISSDKPDYAPGEQVTLTGTGWADGEVVHIVVNDTIGQSWNHTADVTAVSDGTLTDVFNLPNYFVSNYDVTASGPISGVATTTFTDLSIGTYDQCSNDDGDGYVIPPGTDAGCRWINGNLQSNNSTYAEGEATVQRLWLTDLPTGTHSVTLKYGTTKSGKHAYDYLTTWDFSENWITNSDLCQNIDIPGCTATPPPADTLPIPDDPNTPTDAGGQVFTMYNGDMTTATNPAIVSGTYAGDSETVITISFTVDASTCAKDPDATTCDIALWFGAHIASQADWGAGNGAGNIPGSPYHVALDQVDGASAGQRDNQMQSGTVVANGTIVIVKDAIPNDAQDFSFNLTNGTTINQNFLLDDDSDVTLPNSQTFSVAPGVYTAQELNIPAGWSLTNLVCVDPSNNTTVSLGTATATINLASSETVTCTFTDTQAGRIEIEKQTLPDGSTQTFDFTGDVAGTLGDGDSAGENVVPGSYSSTETVPTGWDLTDITCDDSDSTGDTATGVASFEVGPGETVRCVFTNTQRGRIEIEKTESGGTSANTFQFELRSGVDIGDPADPTDDVAGSLLGTATIPANGIAVQIDGLLVPGTYTVCEIVMPGWSTNLPNQYTLVIAGDNSRVCTDVTVGAGETVTLQVDNTPPPGGETRTIGFWKNWTSCDGHGNQDPVLDETLALAGGSILLGDYAVTNCHDAVQILNKAPVDESVKKKASDPVFALASQLLAAKLNIVAGADHACIDATITQADQLLSVVNFNGSSSDTLTKTEKTLALSLANTLDLYNNFGC